MENVPQRPNLPGNLLYSNGFPPEVGFLRGFCPVKARAGLFSPLPWGGCDYEMMRYAFWIRRPKVFFCFLCPGDFRLSGTLWLMVKLNDGPYAAGLPHEEVPMIERERIDRKPLKNHGKPQEQQTRHWHAAEAWRRA
jgi:hypothetical protein